MKISELAAKILHTGTSLLNLCDSSTRSSDEAKNLEQAMERLKSPRHEVGVVGLQGHGKSTLINALLGESLAYSGAEIAQNCVTRIQWGEPRCEVLTKTSDGGLQREVHPVTMLKELGRRGGVSVEPGSEIVAFTQAEFLQDGVCLVDTPGADAGLEAETDNATVEDYLRRANVVLAAVLARKPGLAGVFELLEQAGRSASDVVVALTMSDLLEDEDEVEEAVSVSRRQMRLHFGSDVPVFAVSARRALNSASDGTDATLEMNRLKLRLRRSALSARLGTISSALSALDGTAEKLRTDCTETLKSLETVESELNEGVCEASALLAKQHKTLADAKLAIEEAADMAIDDVQACLEEERRMICWELAQDATSNQANKMQQLADRVDERLQDIMAEFRSDVEEELGRSGAPENTEVLTQAPKHNTRVKVPPLSMEQIALIVGGIVPLPLTIWQTIDNFLSLDQKPSFAQSKQWRQSSQFDSFWQTLTASAISWAKEYTQSIVISSVKCLQHRRQQSASINESLHQELRTIEEQARETRFRSECIVRSIDEMNIRLMPVRSVLQLLRALEPVVCSDVIEIAREMSAEHLDGYAGLVEDIKSIQRCFPDASDEVQSFWSHAHAARHLLHDQEFSEACAQAEMAVELATGVQPDWREVPVKLYALATRHASGPDAALTYLQNQCEQDSLINERIALGLLAGRTESVRHTLSKCDREILDNAVRSLAEYACFAREADCPPEMDTGIGLLHQSSRVLKVEADTDKMVDSVQFDSSLERHIAARLVHWASLEEEESLLVEQAYGAFGALEHLLPASAASQLESWLQSTAEAGCCSLSASSSA